MFISGRIAVTATGITDEKDLTRDERGRITDNVIFVRPKMDYGTRQRVIGAATKLVQGAQAPRGRKGRAPQQDFDLDIGQYQIALLVHNILEWQGPAFAGVPCLPANIERLDMDEPLVQQVLQIIGERNTTPGQAEQAAQAEADEADAGNLIELQPISSS